MRLKMLGLALMWILPAMFTPVQGQTQVCIPQYMDGVAGPFRWQTTLVLQNAEQFQTQARLYFFGSNGQPMGGLTMGSRMGQGPSNQVGPGGVFDPDPMSPGTARSYRSVAQRAYQSGFCILESQDRIQAHARLHLFDGAGNLLSEASIIPGPQFRNGSFFVDRTGDQGVGFALVNPSPQQQANCVLEVFAEDGITPLGAAEMPLGPRTQTARMLFELFPGLLVGEVGYIRIRCDSPICALALQLRGLQMLQIPIVVEDNVQ